MNTTHAQIRAQQRGIPPLMDELLDRFGREIHDGHGAVTVYLDKDSIRRMERELGREPVRRLSTWHDAYKVRRTDDGSTITFGHRTKRLWRK